MTVKNVSIVIPVFNSEESLEELYQRIDSSQKSAGCNYEIIFVDDSSHDHSWDKINELAAKDERILGIRLCRNFGQHNALLCGIRTAR